MSSMSMSSISMPAVPYGGKKKGADTGIDGFIYFKTDSKTTEKAVKAGFYESPSTAKYQKFKF